MKKAELIAKVKNLGFPKEKYVVAGSAIMVMHDLKETKDIDIVVSAELFNSCIKDQWEKIPYTYPDKLGQIWLKKDDIELYLDVNHGEQFRPTLEELLSRAEYFGEIPFLSLNDLLKFKKSYNRPKDQNDIQLIEEYLKNITNTNNSLRIPFYSQIWNLEKWNELGFKSFEDAKYWQNSSCGILCLKMAIEGILNKEIDPISKIILKGQSFGAYSHKSGWSHKGLADLAESYGVKASIKEKINTDDLINLLNQGSLIIISTKWAFQDTKTLKEKLFFWKRSGGHLALVTGHKNNSGFYVNHTSITEGYNWENKLIPLKEFKQGFTGRCIIIHI